MLFFRRTQFSACFGWGFTRKPFWAVWIIWGTETAYYYYNCALLLRGGRPDWRGIGFNITYGILLVCVGQAHCPAWASVDHIASQESNVSVVWPEVLRAMTPEARPACGWGSHGPSSNPEVPQRPKRWDLSVLFVLSWPKPHCMLRVPAQVHAS